MNRRLLVFGLLLIGLFGALYVAAQRHSVESRNRAVEIVLDYDEIQQIAAATGMNPSEVMKRFKDAGATSVAITEETFGDAVKNGNVIIGDGNYGIRDEAARIAANLRMDLPRTRITLSPPPRDILRRVPSTLRIWGKVPAKYLEDLPLGLSGDAILETQQAGLQPVARLMNYPGATPEAIDEKLTEIKARGIRTIIFAGDQVLGYSDAINGAVLSLKKTGLFVGRVEFSKQKGDQKLAEKTAANTIIVHSISSEEMPRLRKAEVVDRFEKAVRERGVRMCYVRMFSMASSDILRDNAQYVNSIAKGIRKAGYTTEPAHPIGEVNAPRVMRAVAGLGVAAGSLLLLLSLFELSAGSMLIWTIGLVVVCAGLAGAGEAGRKIVALLSAIVFPTLAGINVARSTPESPTGVRSPIGRTIGKFVCAVATVAVGGMLIVGLLSERDYMLRVNVFWGVKAAHLFPVLLLGLVYAGGIVWKSGTWTEQKQRLANGIKSLLANPILLWQAAAGMAVLAVVGIMLARSGNDSGVGVSSFEIRFRSYLDYVLYVRPRTKEFLIGYPALIIGIGMALRGMRQWAAPLIVVGAIGLVSALNTFCHIHTPIQLSLLRVINGALVGGVIGLVILYVAQKWAPNKPVQESQEESLECPQE